MKIINRHIFEENSLVLKDQPICRRTKRRVFCWPLSRCKEHREDFKCTHRRDQLGKGERESRGEFARQYGLASKSLQGYTKVVRRCCEEV